VGRIAGHAGKGSESPRKGIEIEKKSRTSYTAKPDPELEKMSKSMAAIPRTCEGQISAGVFAYITEINPRRLVVADVQKGLAVGMSMFQHDGHLKTIPIKGVPGMDSMPGFTMQFNFPSIHFYKIKNGKIYDIETIGVSVPYGTKFGW